MASLIIEGLFGGSILAIQRRLGFPAQKPHAVWREAAWAMALAWVPLATLALVQSPSSAAAGFAAFLADRAIHCRTLIAVPALILGRALSYPQLSRTCAQFDEAGLISEADQPRFAAALDSARRLEASPWAVVGAFVLAYSISFAFLASGPVVPAWHVARVSGLGPYSLAGWWHLLVALPLLLVLLLSWFWRLLLWARLLWRVAGLNLELLPSHPDRAGGLKFLGYGLRSFAPVGFALGVIVAGTLANNVARHDLPLETYRDYAVVVALFVILVFGSPLLVFVRPLTAAWQRGIHQYGTFAQGLGHGFERKWLRGSKPDALALSLPDFSALNDFYQCVANVYAMRVFPVDIQSLLLLAASSLAPILLVAASTLPLDVLGSAIANLLF